MGKNPYESNHLTEDENGNEIEQEEELLTPTTTEDDEEEEDEELYTDSAISNLIEAFLREFKDKKKEAGQYKYFEHVSSIAFSSESVFNLDFNDLFLHAGSDEFIPIFYDDIDTAIATVREAVKSLILEINGDYKIETSNIAVRISNFDIKRSFREIDADLIDKMVTIDAIVNKSSKKKPWLLMSVYTCKDNNHDNISLNNKIIKKCRVCDSRKMIFNKVKSNYVDYKQIYVQELPENLPAGQLPEKLLVSLYGNDIANKCRPGDRIKMTCIVRLDYDNNTVKDLQNHDPLGIKGKNFGTTFEMVLDANNIEKLDSFNSLNNKDNNTLSDTDIQKIKSHKDDPDLSQKLVNSFAPHIYGHEIHKESILIMTVGSVSSVLEDGYTKTKGDSNLLLVGDAGLAKSEMLQFAMKIAPRGLYTTGGGSSAAGLTAAVVKDKSGAMMLEAGAVVMADQGLCCIDEFDKLRAEDRSKLHEAMEQQTCSVAKGGIVATLNARTSILAAANPIDSVYDPNLTIVANTGLPPTLISRFDLIFVLKDVINLEADSAVVDYILGIDSGNNQQQMSIKQYGQFDIEFLAKYVMYAKHYQSKHTPELTMGAKLDIKSYYNKLRQRAEKDSNNATQTMTVTARIVKALERLSIARARLLLKDKVTKDDTGRAKFLMNQMFKSFGIDIETGNTNLGIMFGKPISQMSKQTVIVETCAGLSNNGKNDLAFDVLVSELLTTKKFHTEYEAEKAINECIKEGVLIKSKGNTYSFNKSALWGRT